MVAVIFLTFIIGAVVYYLYSFTTTTSAAPLPPGPRGLPFFGNFLSLRHSLFDIEPTLRRFHAKYGPIITIRLGPNIFIFVSDRALAHKILLTFGVTAATRPSSNPASSVFNSNQHSISTSAHGPLWRLLRRNLTSEILKNNRVKSYGKGREWALDVLLGKLRADSAHAGSVKVMEIFKHTMTCLLLLMCFGEKFDEKQVKATQVSLRNVEASFSRFTVFLFFPILRKTLFRNRWRELLDTRKAEEDALIPFIRARMEKIRKVEDKEEDQSCVFSYVDSLLKLELPEEGGRKLTEGEIVTLCAELFEAGTDTTCTALEWIMAYLVNYPEIQRKLAEEIESVMVDKEEDERCKYVGEEDLEKMRYLKAVVMEGLRLHPPGHFILPHAVMEDVEIEGYLIPKEATLNFLVAEMGRDGEVWEEPMEFRPERFMTEEEVVDITGTKEIKMMPFGAGRRICPGLNLSMLHLEWFVANLVREYEWKTKDGEEVDLTEKAEFTVVMKRPLEAVILPRKKMVVM